MKSLLGTISLSALLLLAVSCDKKQTVELTTTTIETGEINEIVTATGTVESVTQVEVGTQVTGIISNLYADYNSEVKKGQLIAQIDKTVLEAELASANATLKNAQNEYDYRLKEYNRQKQLHDKQLISDYDFETADYQFKTAAAALTKSKNDRVKAATNLKYAEIYAPIDGIVVSRDVEEGQTVVSNMSVATLFTIADLYHMQVVANVDEADIGNVAEGQNVTFTVDAYPNDKFTGRVTQVRLNPTTTSNVVTYEVIVATENPDLKLKPGLTANVSIYVKEVKNILCMPMKAMRFEPEEYDQKGLPQADKSEMEKSKPSISSLPKEDVDSVTGKPTPPADQSKKLVWVVQGNKLIPTPITVGIDNGVTVEILSGLKAGDKVAMQYTTKAATQDNAEQAQGEKSPFMPSHPGDNKKKK